MKSSEICCTQDSADTVEHEACQELFDHKTSLSGARMSIPSKEFCKHTVRELWLTLASPSVKVQVRSDQDVRHKGTIFVGVNSPVTPIGPKGPDTFPVVLPLGGPPFSPSITRNCAFNAIGNVFSFGCMYVDGCFEKHLSVTRVMLRGGS